MLVFNCSINKLLYFIVNFFLGELGVYKFKKEIGEVLGLRKFVICFTYVLFLVLDGRLIRRYERDFIKEYRER